MMRKKIKSKITDKYICNICAKLFDYKKNLLKHVRVVHPIEEFKCKKCEVSFPSSEILKDHMEKHKKRSIEQKEKQYTCQVCQRVFQRRSSLFHHQVVHHREMNDSDRAGGSKLAFEDNEIYNVNTFLENHVFEFHFKLDDTTQGDLNLSLFYCMPHFTTILNRMTEGGSSCLFYLYAEVLLGKYDENGEYKNETGPEKRVVANFRSASQAVVQVEEEISDNLEGATASLILQLSEYNENGSQWYMLSVQRLLLHCIRGDPLSIGGHRSSTLPLYILKKQAVLDVPSNDNQCFANAVLLGYLLGHDPELGKQKHMDVEFYNANKHLLNFDGLTFPIGLYHVDLFEKNNSSIAVNIIGCEKLQNKLKPFRFFLYKISKFRKSRAKVIDLLLFREHFALIINRSALLQQGASRRRRHYCESCFVSFTSKKSLKFHEKICNVSEFTSEFNQHIVMPKGEKSILKFKNVQFTERIDIFFCFDFESVLLPIESCQPNPETSYHLKKHLHQACSFTYVGIDVHGQIAVAPVTYTGADAASVLLDRLQEEAEKIFKTQDKPLPILNEEEQFKHNSATNCDRCQVLFSADNPKTRHHSHFYGHYIAPVCSKCNLRIKRNKSFIKCYAHNLKNYDAYMIMDAILARKERKLNKILQVIPKSYNKYLSFSYRNLQFLDTANFLQASLDSLVKTLNEEDFGILNSHFSDIPAEHLKLLKQKGYFPFEYVTSFDVLKETKLPPLENFYSSLTEKGITPEAYAHATKVFEVMKCQTLQDYLELYNLCDTLLLAAVWYRFVSVAHKNYHLDPCHFVSGPSFFYSSCLFWCKEDIQLIGDYNMHLLITQNIRGGLCNASIRHVKSNNELLSDYDSSKESVYVALFDLNSLYATVQHKYKYPVNNIRFLSDDELSRFSLRQIDAESDTGFMLLVDLDYCLDKEATRYLPLCASHEYLTFEQLSPFNQEFLKKFNIRYPKRQRKLLLSQNDKKSVLLHGLNLMFYLKMGMILKKIHAIISFSQKYWLRDWITLNNDLRRNAKSHIESEQSKFAVNSSFGSFLMSKAKFTNCAFINGKEALKKRLFTGNIVSWTPIHEDLVILQTKKRTVHLDRPHYLAFCILELSKLYFYQMYYEIFLPAFEMKLEIGYIDTDSYCLIYRGHGFYRKLIAIAHVLDTSNYDKKHFLYSDENRQKLYKIKDCFGGRPIREAYFLKSKMYAIVLEDEVHKKSKGIGRVAVKKHISVDDYRRCIEGHTIMKHTFNKIAPENNFQLATTQASKLSLSSFDDKQFVISASVCQPYNYQAPVKKWKVAIS